MLATLAALIPVVALIALGQIMRRRGFPAPGFWPAADALVYWVLFPAYLFVSAARVDLPALRPLAAATAILGPVALLTIVIAALAASGRLRGPTAAVLTQAAIRQNVYVAAALAVPLLGPAAAAPMALAIAISVPSVNTISVWALTRWAPSGTPAVPVLRALLGNPLILASLAGIVAGSLALPLPAALLGPLDLLAKASLPLALLGVGAGLELTLLRRPNAAMLASAVLKLAVLPGLTALACVALGLAGTLGQALVLFAATPTSASAYVHTRLMGGDHVLMAAAITLHVVMATLTVPLVAVLVLPLLP
jgi:predicted permease